MKSRRRSSRRRTVLLVSVGFLVLIGSLIQFSIDAGSRTANAGSPGNHVLSILIGVVALYISSRVSLVWWRQVAPIGYILVIGLLLLVRAFGPIVFGAKRWIIVGGFQLQPSELMKPALALMTAGYVAAMEDSAHRLAYIGRIVLIVAIPFVLVLAQPDLGTSLVLFALWVAQLVLSGLPAKQLAILGVVVAIVGVTSLPLMTPYQRSRVQSFLSGHRAEDASSYNVVQARIAIGSGGVFGAGLGGGTQSQLNFLPARHTDFVFSVVAEKLGLLGAAAVLVAQGAVAWVAWLITGAARSRYTMVLSASIATVLTMQMIVNTMMNVGLLPVTGIPLPFVSYGGTSMVVSLFFVGWLMQIDKQRSDR